VVPADRRIAAPNKVDWTADDELARSKNVDALRASIHDAAGDKAPGPPGKKVASSSEDTTLAVAVKAASDWAAADKAAQSHFAAAMRARDDAAPGSVTGSKPGGSGAAVAATKSSRHQKLSEDASWGISDFNDMAKSHKGVASRGWGSFSPRVVEATKALRRFNDRSSEKTQVVTSDAIQDATARAGPTSVAKTTTEKLAGASSGSALKSSVPWRRLRDATASAVKPGAPLSSAAGQPRQYAKAHASPRQHSDLESANRFMNAMR